MLLSELERMFPDHAELCEQGKLEVRRIQRWVYVWINCSFNDEDPRFWTPDRPQPVRWIEVKMGLSQGGVRDVSVRRDMTDEERALFGAHMHGRTRIVAKVDYTNEGGLRTLEEVREQFWAHAERDIDRKKEAHGARAAAEASAARQAEQIASWTQKVHGPREVRSTQEAQEVLAEGAMAKLLEGAAFSAVADELAALIEMVDTEQEAQALLDAVIRCQRYVGREEVVSVCAELTKRPAFMRMRARQAALYGGAFRRVY